MQLILRLTNLSATLLFFLQTFSQEPDRNASILPFPFKTPLKNQIFSGAPMAKDICLNGIDDDGNGLIDEKDFSCYYDGTAVEGCVFSQIIWSCSNYGLHWADPSTGQERWVGNFDGRLLDDITWASNGKLYGVGNYSNEILEIDPNTSSVTAVGSMPGYYSANGLTADLQGNLYVAAVRGNSVWDVVKFNLASGATTLVTRVTEAGLASGGDLTFLNGFLYLGGDNSKLAKITPATGVMEIHTVINTPTTVFMGIITMGDGYLYVCNIDDIWRIDPVTMQADPTSYYTFQWGNIYMRGLSNYTEHCNGPGCKAKISAAILTPAPYCSEKGVWLKASGTGINGSSDYTWSRPDGSLVHNDSLRVTQSGRYIARYHTLPDTCGTETFIDLVVQQLPNPDLGPDTLLCSGGSILLQPRISIGIDSYLWQNGAVAPSITISQPGTYWLDAVNVCGTKSDTIIVSQAGIPTVTLGPDTALCPGSSMLLQNLSNTDPWDVYHWFNGAANPTFAANQGGIYWVELSNACGTRRDSLTITLKDSCSCFPFYPRVDLGPDKLLCPFETVTLENELHTDGYHYSWNTGSDVRQVTTSQPGTYVLQVSTYCGSLTDTINITAKTEGCIRNIFVPQAFTPNNDGLNDQLRPGVFGTPALYIFRVYNRWGQLIFFSRNPSSGWNGMFQGRPQDSGVYVWQIEFQFTGETKQFQKGIVTLVR